MITLYYKEAELYQTTVNIDDTINSQCNTNETNSLINKYNIVVQYAYDNEFKFNKYKF